MLEPPRCEECGCDFLPTKSGKNRYCSLSCAGIATGRKRKRTQTFTCKRCGKIFFPKACDRTTYCSRECYFEQLKDDGKVSRWLTAEKKYQNRVIKYAQCRYCGDLYEKINGNTFCSDLCRSEYYRESSRKREEFAKYGGKKDITYTCLECGNIFNPEYKDKRRQFCSEKCSKKKASRVNKITRRAAKYGNGPTESIDPIKIFERDGWVCHLCGKRVNKNLKHPHLMSATLDHVIPLSCGGTHTKDNVALAHMICNCKKSNNAVGEQLLLVG